ncbi:hypothetical protein [Bacteroides sp. 51]|uniref:hypothetical protein n=1 Tax=Bacteroides sp. 51 TaxID=2302938 RepID=UPI0013CFDC00|nr:hypothetical protein [Bacteroides sp. 51]NDV81731.1 hypothetical protein [Bacteroides sp. 51]
MRLIEGLGTNLWIFRGNLWEFARHADRAFWDNKGVGYYKSISSKALKAEFNSFVTISAVADPNASGYFETKGGYRQDVAYAPYTLSK